MAISHYMIFGHRKLDSGHYLTDRVNSANDFMAKHPALKDACNIITNNLPYDIDLNGGQNIMMRGSTIVLTDPVAQAGGDSEVLP